MSDVDLPGESEAVQKHEHLDPETIVEDVEDLFEPDNHTIPPLNPDTPPGAADAHERQA